MTNAKSFVGKVAAMNAPGNFTTLCPDSLPLAI